MGSPKTQIGHITLSVYSNVFYDQCQGEIDKMHKGDGVDAVTL